MKPRYLTSIVLILFLFSAIIAPAAAAIPPAVASSLEASGPTFTQPALPAIAQAGLQSLQTGSLSLIGCPVVPVAGIFASPQAGSQPQDFLIQGTCVAFDQRSEDGQWIRIQSGEKLVSHPGWVATLNILLEQPADQLPAASNVAGSTAISPAPSSAAATGESAAAPVGGVNACLESVNSLNVRSGPGIAYRSIGYLLKGSCMTLIARTTSAAWVKSEKGWMSAHYLQVQGDLSQLPIP
jgi:hypothetical protein